MSFPRVHHDGEVWNGDAVTDLENRASGTISTLQANVIGTDGKVGGPGSLGLSGTGTPPANVAVPIITT